MNLIINDKTCASTVGQTLLKAARINHSHIGYLCGGHGVCQTCFVIVLEGAECLSPVTEVEKAYLTPRQIEIGGRMACRATLAREGVIKILTRPEEVRRMLFSNPLPLFGYGAEMGRNIASQVVPGFGNLIGRVVRGEIVNENEFEDFKESVNAILGLTIETLPEYLPFREQVMGIVSKLPFSLPTDIQLQLPFELPLRLPFGKEEKQKNVREATPIKFMPRNSET